MKRKVFLPVLIFVLSLLSSLAILVLWIVWSASEQAHFLWLLQGILLAIPIIGGVITIFVYYTKSKHLDAERVKFISGVSHELLTPVASLRLYTETMLLHDDLPPEKRREFLTLMASDCARLQAQVTSLLTVLRSERGKQEYRLEPADLGLAVENFLAANPVLLKGASVTVTLERGLLALVDLEAFGTLLKNILENAVRYSPGTPRLTLSLAREGKWLKLALRDEGEGMERKQMKKAFRMFYRASRKPGGTGLGLFIVHSIVRAHKGQVSLKSAGRGQGTTVTVLLPAHGESSKGQ